MSIIKRGRKWCVTESDKKTIIKCHPTKKQAIKQLAAIEAAKARRNGRSALLADVCIFHLAGKHEQSAHGKKGPPIGQVSFEAQPSTSLSPVPGLQGATFPEKRAYMRDSVSAMGNPQSGSPDELLEAQGLDGSEPFEVVGVWKGEFNPGMQVEIDRNASQEDVEAYAASVGKTLKQDAVGYHRPFYDGKPGNDQGAEIELGSTISKKQMGSLYDELGKEVGVDNVDDIALVASKDGVRALNFSSLPPGEFQGKLGTAAGNAFEKDVSIGTFDFEGGLVENDWKVKPHGKGYDPKIGKGKPDLSGAVERVNERVGRVNDTWRERWQPQTAASERRSARTKHFIGRQGVMMAKEKEKPEPEEDEDKKKKKPSPDDEVPTTKLFMRKLIKFLRDLLPGEEFDKAMKSARGSAGGEMKKRKRAASEGEMAVPSPSVNDDYTPAYRPKKSKEIVMYTEASGVREQCRMCRFYLGGACLLVEGTIMPEFACELWEEKMQLFSDNIVELCSGSRDNAELQLFNELLEFAEPPDWIPYLPKPGKYNSPKYGDIYITRERNENFIENFEAGVYQESLPISSEHIDADQEGAYGWIEEMRMNEDGSVDAKVSWTDRGKEAIENDRFRYFSPEFHDVYKDNKEVIHNDVAVGGALTTRPFFKEDAMRPLVASEDVLTFSEGEHSITFTNAAQRRREDKMGTSKETGAQKGAPKEQSTLEKFKDYLVNAIKGFNTEDPKAIPKPEPVKVEPKPEPVKASEKTDSERIVALETENQSLRASEAKHTEDANKSSKRIAALEDEGVRSKFAEIVNGSGNNEARWFGLQDDHVDHLMSLHKAFGEDSKELKHYITTQQAHVTGMSAAGIYSEVGSVLGAEAESDTSTPDGAFAELRRLAKEDEDYKARKISLEQALVKVSADHPELKKKYREQFRSRDTVR
ncbi:MAG: hypothetical protein GY896_22930 [Gammaproteobacteria bacterium]|nr:hypothetical protein [Gammaproteobacteria bacterium]